MHAFVHGLLDLILPPVCLACDGLIATGDQRRIVCRRCRARLRPPPPPCCERCGAPRLVTGRADDVSACPECTAWPAELTHARSAYLMHPPADRIVHQLKYRGWSALADVMAEAMVRAWRVPMVQATVTAVVPVPTTGARMRERGYNQAELLARAVAKLLDVPCRCWLERGAARTTQTTLQPAARGANVAGAFRPAAHARGDLEDAFVLIVDDVLTTGATTGECTRTLVAAGARAAAVLTYARAFDTRRLLG